MQLILSIVITVISSTVILNWSDISLETQVIGCMAFMASTVSIVLYGFYRLKGDEIFRAYSGIILIFTLPQLIYLILFLDSNLEAIKSGKSFGVIVLIAITILTSYYILSNGKRIKENS